MDLWDKKLIQLETIISHKFEEDVPNYSIIGDLYNIVENIAAVQLSVVFDLVRVHPSLGNIPDTLLNATTIYDIITHNIQRELMDHGRDYLKVLED